MNEEVKLLQLLVDSGHGDGDGPKDIVEINQNENCEMSKNGE